MAESLLEAKIGSDDGAWAREHLAADVVAWLTTISPNGTPQSSPISFLWDGATIFFYSQPDTPKLRNLELSPRISFHLRGDDHADHALILEGEAAVDPSIPPSDVHRAYQAKYAAPLAHWGMDEAETARRFSVPIRITPTRVRVS
jgi:PPOX class probable F420-dependent enzyme